MEILLILLLFGFLIYSVLKKPVYIVIYIYFFFAITDILLEEVGIDSYRLILKYFFILLLLIFNFKPYRSGKHFLFYFNYRIVIGLFLVFMMIFLHLVFKSNNKAHLLVTQFAFEFFIYVFIPFLVTLLIIDNHNKILQIPSAFIIFGLFYFVVIYLFKDISQIEIGNRTTMERIGFNTLPVSRVSGLLFISSIISLIFSKSKLKYLYSGSAAVGVYMLLVTSQRATILGVIFSLVFLSLVNSSKKSKYVLYALGFASLLFIVGWVNIEQFGVIERFQNLKYYETYQRYDDYSRSFNIFLNNFITGLGPKGYFIEIGRIYPHNIVLELMAEYGIIGLISAFMIIITGLGYSIKLLKSSIIEYKIYIIVCYWLFLLISVFASGNIIDNSMFWISSAFLVIVMRDYKKSHIIYYQKVINNNN